MARNLNARQQAKAYIPKFLDDSTVSALKVSVEKELHDISNVFSTVKTGVSSVNGKTGDILITVEEMNGVTQVNGKTGDVTLNASDVNAVYSVNGKHGTDVNLVFDDIGGTFNVDTTIKSLILTSEALTAGDIVNVYSNGGNPLVRKANASTSGKEANGFVLNSYTQGAQALVHFNGANTAASNLVIGKHFLSTTISGKSDTFAPSITGNVFQEVGFAINSTTLIFIPQTPLYLTEG